MMRRIDELHLELPFYGSRRMTLELNKEGRGVNRKRVRRLMRVMGDRGAGSAPHIAPSWNENMKCFLDLAINSENIGRPCSHY